MNLRQTTPTSIASRSEGELDAGTVDLLTNLLDEAAAPGGPVFLDMTALEFIDSTGVHEIVKVLQALSETGWCLLLHIDDGEVARILELMGMYLVPNIHVVDHRGAKTSRAVVA